MALVSLVRHGQAQTGATDEESYDNLSELGHEQAKWLGAHLLGSGQKTTRIFCGTLRRQRQTAGHISAALGIEPIVDERLNEINYFALADDMAEAHAVPLPTNRQEFLLHLPQAMRMWEEGVISCPNESFEDYKSRVLDAMAEAEALGGAMLVTSGGIIGMAMRHVLGLDGDAFAHVLLQTNNASLHRYAIEQNARRLVTFNATPHLDHPDRAHAMTYT